MIFQNRDGGFGESPLYYLDDGHCDRGSSTPNANRVGARVSLRNGLSPGEDCNKRANCLLETRSKFESRDDASVVGTGHPGILNVGYPVYSQVFPLMALTNYLDGISSHFPRYFDGLRSRSSLSISSSLCANLQPPLLECVCNG